MYPGRTIPVLVDGTDLPPLLGHLKYIDARGEEDPIGVAREILGIESDNAFLLAVQRVIEEAGLIAIEFWGAGVFVCCPKCGAKPEFLRGWQSTDDATDRSYAGAECTICRWSEGSER